jgi:hypothetical protein
LNRRVGRLVRFILVTEKAGQQKKKKNFGKKSRKARVIHQHGSFSFRIPIKRQSMAYAEVAAGKVSQKQAKALRSM